MANNKNIKKKYVNTIGKNNDLRWYYLVPLIFIVAVVPLIVFAKSISLDDIEKLSWRGGDTSTDFFSYYKAIFFAASSFIAAILLVLLRLTGEFKFKRSKYYIPLAVYSLFVLISYFMSDYDVVAKRGFIEQFQGVWVMIAYGLVVFAGINYIQNENHVKLMMGSYVILAIVISVVGLGQYFGHDFFKTEFGKYIVLPENLHHIAKTLEFKFKEREIYLTMYNTNFVGSFADIMLSLSVAFFVYSKGLVKTTFAGVFFILMELIWIGSNSRAGLVGFVLGSIFIVFLFRKKILKLSILVVVGLVVMTGMNIYSGGDVFNEFLSMSPSRESNRLEEKKEEDPRLEDLKFEGNSLDIVMESETLRLTLNEESLSFFDGDGNSLVVNNVDGEITFVDEDYASYRINVKSEKSMLVVNMYDNDDLIIYMTGKNGFKLRGSGGVIGITDYPDRLEFLDKYGRFATSRGYIWSRSIPLLKDTLLIGHGPDTYAIEFPQQDYVGKMNAYGNASIIVDKPHNMFIQIGVNTGVVSLLALLSLFLMYFIDSMKLYWKRDVSTFLDHMGVGCVTAMIAYLGAGFFNDQIISVAPIFYVLVGLGIAINDLVRKQPLED
jgi:hypothetical protein